MRIKFMSISREIQVNTKEHHWWWVNIGSGKYFDAVKRQTII